MQIDRISDVNVLKHAKESVSMSGNAYVSGFSKGSGAANVPDPPIQC
jgi:hypothetical protein